MRQKLLISSALVHSPDVIIVDEPMVGLDPRAARLIKDLLRTFVDQGGTVFLSTHTLEVAEALCDRIAILHGAGSARWAPCRSCALQRPRRARRAWRRSSSS
jgi:ABC-type multidrug transport system ATPase subunit